jgi:hypothetical protein
LAFDTLSTRVSVAATDNDQSHAGNVGKETAEQDLWDALVVLGEPETESI